jgi:hypothetical protein
MAHATEVLLRYVQDAFTHLVATSSSTSNRMSHRERLELLLSRIQLRFEAAHVAFKLVAAASESANVFFHRVARVFQRYDEP